MDLAGDNLLISPYFTKNDYLDSSEEVYARLNQLRKFIKDTYGYDYDHKFTLDEVKKICDDAVKHWESIAVYEDKDGNQESQWSRIGKDGKVSFGINPTIPEDFVLRSQEFTPKFRTDNLFGIIGRYPEHLIWMLLNNVA